MTMLLGFIHAPLAKSLGWSLLHFLWEGALIALVLATLLFLCGPGAARLRYTLCCLALLAMPIAFGFTMAWSLPATPVVSVRTAVPLAVVPVPQSAIASAPRSWMDGMRETLPWVVPFWMAGVLLCYLRSLVNWLAAQRLRIRGVCAAPSEWQERLRLLRERIRIAQPVILLESCLVDVPVVIGLVRPAILMPVGLLVGLSTDQVQAILLHELAHIRRRDYLVNVLQNFVEGLLFYHPAVWWISGLVRAERENCCDDVVVDLNGDPYGYAVALATLENSRWPAREPVLAATGGNLMKRIHRLTQEPRRPRGAAAPGFVAGLLVLTLSVAMGGWQAKPAAAPSKSAAGQPAVVVSAPAMPQPRPSLALMAQVRPAPPPAPRKQGSSVDPETPYAKWMTGDVAYIITDAERAAFKLLTTDGERESFIEQFWLRRDPTPATSENEYKEEHYRRIAYSNDHYSANGLPGWKTDRGRVYITYGPPDELESHPAGGSYRRPAEEGGGTTTTFPFEQWRYQWIEGVGTNVIIEFVDPTMSGEYRMTMDPKEKDVFVLLNRPRDPQLAPDGGRAGATVQPMGSSAALISIPLSGYGSHAVNLVCRIVTAEGAPVTMFEQTVQGPAPLFTRFIAVRPGAHRLIVLVKDTTSGATATDDIAFEVK